MPNKKTFILASHIAYKGERENNGPFHTLREYLIKNYPESIFIKPDLYGEKGTKIEFKNKIKTIQTPKNLLFRFIKEVSIIVNFTSNFKKNNPEQKIIYIGSDPLNSFAGVILKIFKRIDKNIFFTIDYADIRYKFFILNWIYHLIDRISLFFADEAWVVSTRIKAKRVKQGYKSENVKFIPNSINFNQSLLKPLNIKQNLILVSGLTETVDFGIILKLAKMIQGFNQKLSIIGEGPLKKYFQKITEENNLQDTIEFLGQKDHAEVLDFVSRSKIGIAWYSNKMNFNRYGDSMKVREYLACGTPIIMNTIPSTADDLKDAQVGLVLNKFDIDEVEKYLTKIFKDNVFYSSVVDNCINIAKKYDKDTILNNALNSKFL